ncbi:c-type cytochrome [Sphingobacterium cellulitidis]|uniref:c-type cytochrome n=1 Tax=Sphingobacterium cellulitidis TaxID=1768011 RepID=UPI003C7AF073
MIKTKRAQSYLFAMLLLFLAGSCKQEKEKEVVKEPNPKTDKIVLPEGFEIEHIYSPSDDKKGSWVSMTFDDKGRMITSDQFGGLFRVELPPLGSDSTVKPKIEALDFPIEGRDPKDTSSTKVGMGFAQGLLWAYNSLYVMINHRPNENLSKGSGLYRLQDTNNDDKLDKITQLMALDGEGEHGPHSIVLGPDSMIYVIAGNFTTIPKMDNYRSLPSDKVDNLIPYILDTHGHDSDSHLNGGWIAKTDSEGKSWDLIASGMRNGFDLAFNNEGELFTYDSDMEWDFGMPWYRPTRILHVTSGAEYGWRKGDAKWDERFLDNLPATLNIGQGSPTNFINPNQAKFPEKYRNSLLAFDWSFGIIYAIHLEPKGSSYTAKAEEFISGSPLPLTDGTIGPDGSLYFLTGGRRLESDLYRVYHKDREKINNEVKKSEPSDLVKLRREIEQYHRPSPAGTVDKVWEYLGHEDRHIRYAARIAVEHQPFETWKDKVFAERNVVRLTEVMVAMAHVADASMQPQIMKKLATIPVEKITPKMLENLLRVYELVIARMGKVNDADAAALAQRLEPFYPAKSNYMNRELSKILLALNSEPAVKKSLELLANAKDDTTQTSFMNSSNLILRNPQYGLDIADMLANIPPAQQIFMATALSNTSVGWTPELREQYFNWFYKAFGFKGGNSYIGFIDNARKMALKNVPQDQLAMYGKMSGDSLINAQGNRLADKVEGPKGPGRGWEIDSALKVVDENTGERNFKRGRELFLAVKCGSCHTVKGEGGSVGPDLTQLGTRFSKRDMLEAIIEPSKVISDQYESKLFHMKDGTNLLGRLMSEDEKNYVISQNPYAPQVTKTIAKSDVKSMNRSEVSIMPPGTLNSMNPDEVKDIMAYLMSGGNENSDVYKKK